MNTLWLDLLGAEVRYRGREFKTRTIETGAHNPQKLILIHGVGGHAEAYARNMQRLGERFHAIAIDLVWHGLSSKPEFTPEMVPVFSRQVLDIFDDLGVQKGFIEGESLGGWVACWTALHHPERVEKVIGLLRSKLAEPPNLEEIGRFVGCSPFHLSRTFSAETGQTIPQYLRQLRLERAAELLRSGKFNVTEAALEVGYSSLSHFSQAFHEEFGCCPGLYPLRTPTQKNI